MKLTKKVKLEGKYDCWDLTVKKNSNFVAEGIVIHNSFAAFLHHIPIHKVGINPETQQQFELPGTPKFYCRTRTRWLEHDNTHVWSRAAKKHDLEEKLKKIPNMVVCGEVYGQVQDLKYGHGPGEVSFAAFDIWHTQWNKFLDYDAFVRICDEYEIPRVPEIYRGPWISLEHIKELAERNTLAGNDPNQIAEGVVVKYTHEAWNPAIGRMILKLPSDQYLTRK